jgi:hypothetical protein
MAKYFKQVSTGLVLSTDNKKVVEQYEKHAEAYLPCDADGKVAAKKPAKADADGKVAE